VSERSRVHVIALGGTISMTGDGEDGVRPTLSAADLLGSVGQAPEVDVTSETLFTVPGSYLTIDDLLVVARRVAMQLREGASGVVVVQGTDTLEETAFVADLVAQDSKPVVFTGAMRPPDALGADGPANLRDAIVAAASVRTAGALVCMGTELHAARYVAKCHAFSPAAFQSPSAGPLGWVVENRASLLTSLPDVSRFDLDDVGGESSPKVVLHRVSLGDDGSALEALAALNPAGIVLEGFGAGHANPAIADVAEGFAASIPVVLASRTGGGSVLTSTYGFAGSERDLLARGLISAGRLDGLKAKLLLSLSLRAGETDERRRARFAAWSH
jgi:L-asparaginase